MRQSATALGSALLFSQRLSTRSCTHILPPNSKSLRIFDMSQLDGITLPRSAAPIAIVTSTTGEYLPAYIAALPNELLAEVFIEGLDGSDLSPWSSEGIPFQTLVSHVSHHWRIVAHSTPQLWTTFIIDTNDEKHLQNAASYIERSKALCLNLSLHLPHSHTSLLQLPHVLPKICLLLCAHVERFRLLRVESDTTGFEIFQFLFANIGKKAPRLEALELQLYDQTYYPPGLAKISLFPDGLPSIISLHFHGMSPQDVLLPQCSISSLHLHDYCFHHSSILNASHAFAFLTQLILSEMNPAQDWQPPQVIEFPMLKKLYMRWFDNYGEILSRIVAPELDTIYLESVTAYEMDQINDAIDSPDSHHAKFPCLRHLILRLASGRTLLPSAWNEVMRAFRQVTHFTLLDADVHHLLQCFNRTETSQALWPMLEVLALPNARELSPESMMSAISNRARLGYPIRRIQLSPRLFARGESTWRDAGVDVQVMVNPLAGFPTACRAGEWIEWSADPLDPEMD